MSASVPGKAALVAALTEEWAVLDELLASLPDDAWNRPSDLPGWTVRDIVAHLIGFESWLAGEPGPSDADLPSLLLEKRDIAGFNERWVGHMRGAAPQTLVKRFRLVTSKREEALSAMSDRDFQARSWSPVGQASYGRFMRIRLFDCWLHEQDIRDAVAQPGHEDGPCAELAFDEIQEALGYVVGKRAGAPDGSSVTVDLTGPLRRAMHVTVDGRASLVDELDRPATAIIRMTSGLFARLAGGRLPPDVHLGEVEIAGDEALGLRVVKNLAFTV